VRRGDRGIRACKVRVLGADRLRPIADKPPIGDPSRPRLGEDARVLDGELDLQPLLGRVWIDDAAPVGRIDPIRYGAVFSLGFGGGFAVDQPVTLNDVQSLAVGGPKASTVENGATLMTTVSTTSVSPSYRPTE
jgi:hypothetical protein